MSDTEPSESPPPTKTALFLDAADKTADARATFAELYACTYSSKHIGSSGHHEYMACDCSEQWDGHGRNEACSEETNCINRVTSVECINGHSGCGTDCQNQRFQRRVYADVSVFQTEKKGFGLRTNAPIDDSGFIYEYIGEVIDETAFRARMLAYDAENRKHFYFMMLKNDAFIDATVKGSLARFCNHSCRPNAYVDKWVVGDKLRMGIFAKRAIAAGEEITFDYNVDRYGAQSQPCYCGEPNCIQFMGGKTQTDAALLLPDGIADALGVSPKVEKRWLKENKHLRKLQQADDAAINEKFVQTLDVSDMAEQDVSKVMGALMKTQELSIVRRLVERIAKTNDDHVNSVIIRFHGYKTLSTVLQAFQGDEDLVESILAVLAKWPKVTRNKISSSQIESVVRDLETAGSPRVRQLAGELLAEWGKLQMAYRIPKSKEHDLSVYGRKGSRSPRDSPTDSYATPDVDDLPGGWEVAFDPNTKSNYYFHRELNLSRWDRPTLAVPTGPKVTSEHKKPRGGSELARREEERLKEERETAFNKLKQHELELQQFIQKSGEEHKKQQAVKQARPDKKADKKDTTEQRWTHLLAKNIPNLLKKYEAEIGRDNVKGCARDLVKILVQKEVKKGSEAPRELDGTKVKKIHEYSKQFMEKFLVKYREKKRKRGGDREDRKKQKGDGKKSSEDK